jgi:hypothetical protein
LDEASVQAELKNRSRITVIAADGESNRRKPWSGLCPVNCARTTT